MLSVFNTLLPTTFLNAMAQLCCAIVFTERKMSVINRSDFLGAQLLFFVASPVASHSCTVELFICNIITGQCALSLLKKDLLTALIFSTAIDNIFMGIVIFLYLIFYRTNFHSR